MRNNDFDVKGMRFTLKSIVFLVFLLAIAASLARIPTSSFFKSLQPARDLTISSEKTKDITAKAYLVGDLTTGKLYAEKNSTTKRPIASISKLLTALVGERNLKPGLPITLPSGESMAVADSYYSLLMESNNTVADSIANLYGYDRFITAMNTQAKTAGMASSHFADPSGISGLNISTAKDLFALAKYMRTERNSILAITKTAKKTIHTSFGTTELRNFNLFSGDPRFLGGKIGFTDEAGQTMLSLFALQLNGEMHEIAIIVLGSEHREKDTAKLLYLLTN